MTKEPSLPSQSVFEGFNLSPQQKHIWRIGNGNYNNYNIIYKMTFHGAINAQILKQAVVLALQKYEIFRTTFQRLSGMDLPLQVIQDETMLSWEEHTLFTVSNDSQHRDIDAYIDEIKSITFDVTDGPSMHFHLLGMDKNSTALLIRATVLCADNRTLYLLAQQIGHLYYAALQKSDEEVLLDEEVLQYADLSEWLNELLRSDEMPKAQQYWEDNFKTTHSLNRLLGGKSAQPSSSAHSQYFNRTTYHRAILQDIDTFVSHHHTSPEIFFLACWKVLIWYSSGETEFIMHTAADGRKDEMLQEALGPLMRYLPLASQISVEDSFLSVVQQTAAQLAIAHQWQDYYVDEQYGGMTPFLRFAFDYANLPDSQFGSELRISHDIISSQVDHFSIKLFCIRSEHELALHWEYDGNMFSSQSIGYLHGRLLSLINIILNNQPNNQNICLKDLMLVGHDEQVQLLETWNNTSINYQNSDILHHLFEEQVAQHAARPALLFGDEEVNYATLNERANQLAHWLWKRGVGPESLVAICMERSIEMMVGILGILKAGGAYIPIGSENPKARIDAILKDIQSPLLITHKPLAPIFEDYQGECLFLDTDIDSKGIGQESVANPSVAVSPANAAYTIYTSGSTGTPKGVVIPHSAVCNRLYWGQQHNPLIPQDRILQVTALGFDVAVWEIFAPLTVGACLVIASPNKHQDTHYLCNLITQKNISIIHFVPTLLRAFLADPASSQCTSIHYIACGGEILLQEDQQRFFQTLQTAELHNPYGPTEATIDATYWKCRPEQLDSIIPIGSPIANMRAFVLDEQMRPVPIGRQGELYLGGSGLARGYHQQAALTSEKFVPDLFSSTPGERLYRTGDLVSYRQDGVLLFQGRLDQQVKLHGFRIELGEIENVLSKNDLVEQCVVIIASEGNEEIATATNQRLVAYIVPKKTVQSDNFPAVSEWQKFLYQHLPIYMIPTFFIPLESLPSTPNGKVDRKALPSLQSIIARREEQYVAPRNAIETVLANLWREALEIPRVSIYNTFAELGGHSLVAMQIISRIRDIFQIELPLRIMFEQPSVTEQAKILVEMEKKPGQTEKIAQILLQIQRMSEKDITHMLEKKS